MEDSTKILKFFRRLLPTNMSKRSADADLL
jgi:hypothetical protein